LWGLAASIALSLAGGLIASSRLLRKDESVSQTSRDIVKGDFERRVPVTAAGDEFDHLAASVNAMLDRIQTLMTELRQVTTDIAHDMRTPLTRLRQRLELAQRGNADAESLRTTLASTVREIDVILGIFGALLRIAQVESGARHAGFETLDLSELVRTSVELYRPAAEEKNQTLAEDISDGLFIRGDHELLAQLFANLIENAVRHSPAGAVIGVRAKTADHGVQIIVADNGAGIPAGMHAKVLQRFFRLENSRTTPGHGLGLSLAAAIAKLHDAHMVFSNNEPGLRVTVSFRTEA
jgi:signal transduction histidine kinase